MVEWTKEAENSLFREISTSTSLMHTVFKRASPRLRDFIVLFQSQEGVLLEIFMPSGLPKELADEYRNLKFAAMGAGFAPKGKRQIKVPRDVLIRLIGISNESIVENQNNSVISEQKNDPIHEAREWLRMYLKKAIREKASDLHFCVRKRSSSVLMRVHGFIEKIDSGSYAKYHGMLSALYNSDHDPRSNSNEGFNTLKDTSCTMTLPDMNVKLRWQTVSRGSDDEYDVVMRLIPSGVEDIPMSLEQIGFLPAQQREIEMICQKPDGLVIMAGVTGSGKSTTLQSMMSLVRGDGERKIYSLEDPIEKIIYGVTQVQIQRDHSDTERKHSHFAQKIVTLMRSDPDVIMVGEIRDAETANACVDAVRTGHLIFTTLHAPSAIGIIDRLTSPSMRIEPTALATPGILSCLIYQRLLPVLCPHCKIPFYASEMHMADEPLKYHLFSPERYNLDISSVHVMGNGCEQCHQRKIIGQTVCAEIIRPNDNILKAIREMDFVSATRKWRETRRDDFKSDGFVGKTAMEIALYKVNKGLIDPYFVTSAFGDFGLYDIIGN